MATVDKTQLYCTCECGTQFTSYLKRRISCPFCMREYLVMNNDNINFGLIEIVTYTEEGEPLDDI